MLINPKEQKLTILGLPGGGKTTYAKATVRANNLKVLVWSPHRHDFEDEGDNFYFYEAPFIKSNAERFWGQAKKLCEKGVIDGVLVDEFDMLYKNVNEIGQNATDCFTSHRHFPMCIIAMTRRPQDIPAYFIENSVYIVSFALQGENVCRKLNNFCTGFGDQVCALEHKSYKFYIKEIGKAPVLCDPIKV